MQSRATIRVAAALVAILFANAAGAGSLHIQPPPGQYNHTIAACYGRASHLPCMRVTRVTNIDIVCMMAGRKAVEPGAPVLGCALVHPNGLCEVAIRKDLTPFQYAQVLHHERGHCNGWVHR